MALKLYVVRHGRTVFNVTGRLQGWSDSPLTPEGKIMAERLGKALSGKIQFDIAFSSPSPRALETARTVLDEMGQATLPIGVKADFREYCFGGFEGEQAAYLHQLIAKDRGVADVEEWLHMYRHGNRHLLAESVSKLDPLQLAETEAQFMNRIQKGLAEIAENVPDNSQILLVSHGMTITGILKSIEKTSTLYKSVKNTTVSRLEFEKSQWKICTIGEILYSED